MRLVTHLVIHFYLYRYWLRFCVFNIFGFISKKNLIDTKNTNVLLARKQPISIYVPKTLCFRVCINYTCISYTVGKTSCNEKKSISHKRHGTKHVLAINISSMINSMCRNLILITTYRLGTICRMPPQCEITHCAYASPVIFSSL